MSKERIDWASREFEYACFGDKRLTQRLSQFIGRVFQSPSKSIHAACRGAAEVMGAYRFLKHSDVDVEKILAAHQAQSKLRAVNTSRVYFVQDTSELNYTRKKEMSGRGRLSADYAQGFYLDCGYLLNDSGLPLGIERCHIYARDSERKSSGKRLTPEKESHRWYAGYEQSCELASSMPEHEVVFMADRESDIVDIYGLWSEKKRDSKRYSEWIIRKNHNRNCFAVGQTIEEQSKVDDVLARSKALGKMSLTVKSKTSFQKVKGKRIKIRRKGRDLKLEVRSAQIKITPPRGKRENSQDIIIWVIEAKEVNVPKDEEPIHWVLFTSLPASTLEQAIDLIQAYALRWEIEVLFRVLKTGCEIEELQIKDCQAVKNAIACYLIVSWRIMYLTKIARTCPQLPCDALFETEQWQALWTVRFGLDALDKLKGTVPSIEAFVLVIASYGGYLNRKGQEPPGPQSMWIGLQRLEDFTLAWQRFGPTAR